jgi:hypothetical protein
MESGIGLKYLWHDIDVYEFEISASNGIFSGSARAYVGMSGLSESAAQLEGFPKDPSDIRDLQFGEFGEESAGGCIQLRFFCNDLAGHSVVEIRIETERDRNLAAKWNRPAESAHFFAEIEASAVDDFVVDLRRMEIDRSGSARLRLGK